MGLLHVLATKDRQEFATSCLVMEEKVVEGGKSTDERKGEVFNENLLHLKES